MGAAAVTLALPRPASKLVRLLGSTTLGAYVLQGYLEMAVHRYYAEVLPHASAPHLTPTSRLLTVLGGQAVRTATAEVQRASRLEREAVKTFKRVSRTSG